MQKSKLLVRIGAIHKAFQWLEANLRKCVICRAHAFGPINLCRDCQSNFSRIDGLRGTIGTEYNEKIEHYYLMQLEELWVKNIVIFLKGSAAALGSFYNFFAGHFLLRWSPPPESDHLVFIPAPSSRFPGESHAHGLAKALAEKYHGEYLDILRYSAGEAVLQKKKGRQERARLHFDPCADAVPFGKIIFVDDVLTTGGTALAAWRALGKPQNYQVWTLAYQASKAEARLQDLDFG